MRERLSLDPNWRFALGHASNFALDFEFARDRGLVKAGEARGAAGVKFDDSKWRRVDLPHDWAVELPLDPTGDKELAEHGFIAIGPGHPEHSVGWYRRTFEIPKSDFGRRISVEFDGVFRDSIVWINGHRLGRHPGGYTSFRYDLTDLLNYGETNVIAVRVDATNYEGWWYDGAGIYRHVWLVKTAPLHVPQWGTHVVSRITGKAAELTVRTRLANEGDEDLDYTLRTKVSHKGRSVAAKESKNATLGAWSNGEVEQTLRLDGVRLWSCDEPNLYTVRTEVVSGRKVVDAYETTVGVRSLRWDAAKGFFLNGKPLKIKGTCNHQHHAGVGTAMPERLHEFRLEKLKEMGSNAYRCSHYAATPELLDLCDRMGFLVMAENRLAGTGPEVLADFESMIVRDRNHPSIFIWSIANEEHTVQWAKAGERIGKTMVRIAHRLDPTRKVTAAMHDRGLGEGFANVVDVHGWNYMKVGDVTAFHERRPEQPIFGSEEASTVCTRGIYEDDASKGYVSAYDKRTPGWGSTSEKWWTFFDERSWLAGGFVWIGFDHRGEPIPYKWPCTTSHFGLMDLCGFPKDNYYYYQAWWSDRPVLHLFPHWNWTGKEGQEIDVRCFTNCDRVELFLNGESQGTRDVKKNSHAAWRVLYAPGKIETRGFRGGKQVMTEARETTGPVEDLRIEADRIEIKADGSDITMLTVTATDAAGRDVPIADNVVTFDVVGPGRLIGVGNGDPSSHESDKVPFRRMFNGLCMGIVQSKREEGAIVVVVRSPGVTEARVTIRTTRAKLTPSVT